MDIKKQLYNIYSIIFALLIFSVPFENRASAIPNILLVLLCLLGPFFMTKERLIGVLKRKKSYTAFLLMVFLMLLFSYVNDQLINDMFLMKKILIICVIIFFSIPFRNLNFIKKAFVISVFFAVCISCFYIIEHIYITKGFQFTRGDFINDILISERLYLGFCCTISIVFSLDFYVMYQNKRIISFFFLLNALCLFVFLFFIVARIALISSVLVFVYFCFKQFSIKSNAIIGFVAVSLFSFFFILNGNLSKRFHLEDKYRKGIVENVKTREPRFVIWECSYNIIVYEHNFIVGNGYKRIKDLLVDCYQNSMTKIKRRDWFVSKGFNTHNQFLDVFMGSGVFALGLLLLVFCFLKYESKEEFVTNSLLCVLFLFMLVENVFHRQLGCYLFGLIFVVIEGQDKVTNRFLV